MAPITIGYIGIAARIVLLFNGMHIGVVMGLIGFAGMAYLKRWDGGLAVLITFPYTTWASYDFSVIPLLVLMGEFCFQGEISGDLYAAALEFFGNLQGSPAMVIIGACATFTAVSGSSMASATTMSAVVLPEMCKRNYDLSRVTGTMAAVGTIGILIPPALRSNRSVNFFWRFSGLVFSRPLCLSQ